MYARDLRSLRKIGLEVLMDELYLLSLSDTSMKTTMGICDCSLFTSHRFALR